MNKADNINRGAECEYISQWLKGIPYEVAFWRSYYASRRRRRDLFSWSHYGKPCSLDLFDVQGYISSLETDAPLVLDLGCALSYAMGNVFESKPRAEVRYVDPLAPFYNRIINRYGVDRPAIDFGMIESISNNYKTETVDLIHVRNALDHCADPMRGIIESVACLRVGGVLYLNHFRNEARRENYRGFHQWNIDVEDGALVLWNEKESIVVADVLGDTASIVTSVTAEGRVVAAITKCKPLPLAIHDPSASALRASAMLMSTVVYFHSFQHSATYQLSRLWLTVAHRVVRLLPLSLINPLKALLGKK